jgi:hypothetical protein
MSDAVISSEVPAPPFPAPAPNWQEQDQLLRDMWMQNKTPQEISGALNRSIPAIMTRAARLGLPRRSAPGRKPGRRALEGNNGLLPPETRRASAPRSSMALPEDAPVQTSLRVCLMCLSRFESTGRHNRICMSCKHSAEYESASALPDIHIPAS